jgi:4a-hydroxytetrahydrobiopterin dehydratase
MWQDKNDQLYKKFEFMDFKEAFSFMQKVAEAAETANHHPKWLNDWNIVEVWLTSHDAGSKVTDKDRGLAKIIDQLAEGNK